MDEPRFIAAVDLGSTSFHLLIARLDHGQLQIVDKLKEMVQLAAGIRPDRQLRKQVRSRCLDCLAMFSHRLTNIPADGIRAVGTNSFRRLRDGGKFHRQAEKMLGHPIEIVSGREEARLIYLGVSHDIAYARDEGRRLVIDIGGGSTELIIGKGATSLVAVSIRVGCVDMSRDFFPDGVISQDRLLRAELLVRQEIAPVKEELRAVGWDNVVGASGTIGAIADIARGEEWSEQLIDGTALDTLGDRLLAAGNVRALRLEGLTSTRAEILAGGYVVLSAIFRELMLDSMAYSDGALREGLLYDMLGRLADHDVREPTVSSLTQRYSLDEQHAAAVETSAGMLFDQLADAWHLSANHRKLLLWAARLHEIGLAIAHSRYHYHGAYLLEHSDLAGFSRQDQGTMALLVRAQRRHIPLELFRRHAKKDRKVNERLTVMLRLAVLLHRTRSPARPQPLRITVVGRKLVLTLPPDWLSANPLTEADLEQEAKYLKALRLTLAYR